MSDRVRNLLHEGRIGQYEYDTYILFEGNDLGRRVLKDRLLAAVMEEPVTGTGEAFAFADGRRSVWREINLIILKIQKELEKTHDNTKPRRPGRFDPSS